MTFLDFFAGIGTIRIGFEKAGWTCSGHVEWDKFAQASYKAMHNIKDGEFNGWDIREVRADELPKSDLWTFGAPCQDFSIAGKRKGMDGERSSLVNEIFRLIEETPEENKPTWLLYENVKGMLSSNGGWDFLGILLEMDRLGYDVEWQLLNSKHFGVPQNRERVFTLGHFRGRGGRKVFPIGEGNGTVDELQGQHVGTITTRTGQANAVGTYIIEGERVSQKVSGINQIANIDQHKRKRKNPHTGRVYGTDGISPCLSAMQGGGLEPKIAISGKTDERMTRQAIETYNSNLCEDGDMIQPFNRKVIKDGLSPTLTTRPEGFKTAVLPIQNFRIRKLTPKECWRLQGIPDYYFDKASVVNSDSQLYKQAGNACTVNVIYEIAKRI